MFDVNGKFLRPFGECGKAAGQFLRVFGVAIDDAGHITFSRAMRSTIARRPFDLTVRLFSFDLSRARLFFVWCVCLFEFSCSGLSIAFVVLFLCSACILYTLFLVYDLFAEVCPKSSTLPRAPVSVGVALFLPGPSP